MTEPVAFDAAPEQVWARIQAQPRADFWVEDGDSHSYGDLAAAVGRVAAGFDAAGAAPGDQVLIVTSRGWTAASVFLAALLDGLVPAVVSAEAPRARVAAVVEGLEPRIVVTDWHRREEFPGVATWSTPGPGERSGRGLLGRRRAHGPVLGLPDQVRGPRVPPADDTLAALVFTSGSTSTPTAVRLTRRNVFAHAATLTRVLGYDRSARIANDLPLTHVDGTFHGPVVAAFAGAAVVRCGRFELAALEPWLDTLHRRAVTHLVTVPTVLALVNRLAEQDDYLQDRDFRATVSSGAPLVDDVWRRFEERFGKPVVNIYGLSETVVGALYAGSLPGLGATGTLGAPIDCEARLGAAGPGDDGAAELELRGENVFPGYWRDDARTAAAFTGDGWFRTGDLVRLRPDGSYEYAGRLKSIIKSGGLLVNPGEVDAALLGHPSVLAAVTVGLPHPDFHEVPAAAVIVREGDHVGELELTDHLRERLEPFKVPRRILVVPELPLGATGKPDRDAVRRLLEERAAAAPQPGGDVRDQVFAIAAEQFRVPVDSLDDASAPGRVPGWDSFATLVLIITCEERLGVSVPLSRAAGVRSLGDLVEVLGGAP